MSQTKRSASLRSNFRIDKPRLFIAERKLESTQHGIRKLTINIEHNGCIPKLAAEFDYEFHSLIDQLAYRRIDHLKRIGPKVDPCLICKSNRSPKVPTVMILGHVIVREPPPLLSKLFEIWVVHVRRCHRNARHLSPFKWFSPTYVIDRKDRDEPFGARVFGAVSRPLITAN